MGIVRETIAEQNNATQPLTSPFSIQQDGAVLLHDLRSPSPPLTLHPPSPDTVASLAWQRPDADPGDGNTLAAGIGCGVTLLDARAPAPAPPPAAFTAADDVAGVAFAHDGTTLAIVDDTGSATVASLATQRLRIDATLRSAHDSLASAAVWRPGSARHLVTAGLDCTAALWDVTARRCTARWRAGGGVDGDSSNQMFNPPFVHALAAPPGRTTGVTANLIAAACGDGSILLLDARSSAGGARRGGRPVPPPPLAVLSTGAGGHTAAATALAFVDRDQHDTSAPRILASGGDDGRLLLWSWRAAISAPPPPWRDAVATDADAPVLVAEIAHGRKVQALAVGVEGRLAVCDVGEVVTVVEAAAL